jgi:UDPglucose--hexose-1-phosphate uridylyltransferase
MNETRYDWLTDRWVIFAPNREERPNQYKCPQKPPIDHSLMCPFCVGAENQTPDATLVLPDRDWDETNIQRRSQTSHATANHWQVRVVPNKFPAVPNSRSELQEDAFSFALDSRSSSVGQLATETLDVQVATAVQKRASDPMFQRRPARGGHEVIVEAPNHIESLTALESDHIALVLEAFRRRLLFWRSQRELKYAVVFKNVGADAGASLYHSHSQLISLDFVPRDIERTQERLALFFDRYDTCYWCQVISEEEEREERLVANSDYFVAVCPFASRFPYGFTIVPRIHRSSFENLSEVELIDLAEMLKSTLVALERAQPNAAYNLILQTSPFQGFLEPATHWRIRVIPRLSKVAGFEWGADCFINTVTPEQSAARLRSLLS